MEGDIVILDETTSTKKEIIHYKTKIRSLKKIVLICRKTSLQGEKQG